MTAVGTILDGRYQILRVLGQGGFGTTYEAVNLHTGQHAAVKERHSGDPERFLQEARVLRDFAEEEAVVTVLDYFEENGTACIVMEFLEGITLREEVRLRGPLSGERAVRLFTPLMTALCHMHEKGVLHRDVSPDNVFVMEDDSLKLLDFGAAKEYRKDPHTKLLVYKNSYSPPEMLEETGTVGPELDVYALAATLYFALTGKDPEDVVSRLLFDELEKPTALGADLLPEAESLLLKGMTLDREERLGSVRELKDGLLLLYPDLTEEERAEALRRKKRRRRTLAGLLLAAGLCGLLILYLNRIPLSLKMRETETLVLDGSAMTEEEFRAGAGEVRRRVAAFSGGCYLWKEEDRRIRLTLPLEVYHGADPQKLTRIALTRPMRLYLFAQEADGGERELGQLLQEEDVAEYRREGETETLVLTEAGIAKCREALEKAGTAVHLTFDAKESYYYYGSISATTGGDGKSLTFHGGTYWLPEALVRMLLTRNPSPKAFLVQGEWKTRWEEREATLIPGRGQVNEGEIAGEAVSLRYKPIYGYESEKEGYVASLLAMEAIMKNRLDAAGVSYAIGVDRWDGEQIVVKVPVDGLYREEAEALGDSIRFYLGDGEERWYTLTMAGLKVKEEAGGSFSLQLTPYRFDDEEIREKLKELLDRGEALYLYCGDERVAVGDAAGSLRDYEEAGVIFFRRWMTEKWTGMEAASRPYADFLEIGFQQGPMVTYSLSDMELYEEGGAVAYFGDNEKALEGLFSREEA